MPEFIPPCLATLTDKVPSGDNWVHEIKFDGYRIQLHKREGNVRLYTRRGHDWSRRFSSLAEAAWHLPATHLILDGEVIVLTESGHSDFGALEDDLGAGRSDRFIYYVFDLLHLNALSIRDCSLADRKRVLAELMRDMTGPIRLSEHLEGGGSSLFTRACQLELEGLVSKRTNSKYRSGRTIDWTKRTCRTRETFVAAGVALKRGKFDGVYLARRNGRELLYAGKVENGFSPEAQRQVLRYVDKLRSREQPLTRKIRKPKATWLMPQLKVDVEYRALTGTGKLRHPLFKGIREDL